MFELLLITQCITGSIINIDGICVQPVVQQPQTRKETPDEWWARQNHINSELNRLYRQVYMETFCDPLLANLKITERMTLANDKAMAVSMQYNDLAPYTWFPHVDNVKYLDFSECQ